MANNSSSSPSSLTSSTETIKIYEKTYHLPVLNSSGFSQLQKQIQQRQQVIKAGKIDRKSSILGLFRFKKEITIEEQFQELQRLIKDYNQIIAFLNQHKKAYQVFFVGLTDELKGIVNKRCGELAQLEQKRLDGLEEAEDDLALVEFYQSQQQRIFRNAFVLHRAAQLMLRKVNLINRGIQKLADDQLGQKNLLLGVVKKFNKYQNAYGFNQEMDRVERDINKLAEVAVNFESMMSDFFAPFQGLIDQVVSIDQELSRTVEEIRILSGDILNQDVRLFAFDEAESISSSIIDFLVKSNSKQEHIRDALDNMRFETLNSLDQLLLPPEVLESTSLTAALNSIQNEVNDQLNQLSSSYEIESQPSYIDIGVNLTPEVELKSKKGINYRNLRDLLAQGKWKEADAETAKVMCQAVNRVQDGWLRESDVDKFPCEDLRTINQLWLHYSGGKFGFSVQAEIYRSFGGTRKYNEEVWKKFGDAVGWRVNNSWLNYSEFTFDLSSPPKGHLPEWDFGYDGVFWGEWVRGVLFSRVQTCRL